MSTNEQHEAFSATSKRPTRKLSTRQAHVLLNMCAVRSVMLFLDALTACRLFIIFFTVVLKGLAMIFADKENPFIILRSKEINIHFKTNNKIPRFAEIMKKKQGFFFVSFILEGTLTVFLNFLKFKFYYVWCI